MSKPRESRGFGMSKDPDEIHDVPVSTPALGAQRAFAIEIFCRRFGVGRTKVYEEIKLGRLRARKIGRRTVITDDDAEEWLRRLPVMKAIDPPHGAAS
jgi:excisionase family DNA binding protein